MVGNHPQGGLVAIVKQVVDEPLPLQDLKAQVEVLEKKNVKITRRAQKLKEEMRKAFLWADESAQALQKVQDVIEVLGDVWMKAKMFDA